MEQWIIPCNLKYYDVIAAFKELKVLNWKQSSKSIKIGDEVYIYVGKPIQSILYKCIVNKVNLKSQEIDDTKYVLDGELFEYYGNYMELQLIEEFNKSKYSLTVLKQNGLKGNIQGPRRVNGILVYNKL